MQKKFSCIDDRDDTGWGFTLLEKASHHVPH